ncbi:MAG: hypothetical protein QOC67_4470, partial [Pseudonocardiales bacterium]|nr:hypothetical protein [Pseudonocardiales bacterium]
KAPPGVLIRQVTLVRDERRIYQGVELTTPVRTAYDLARRCSLAEAVVAVDALAGRFGFAPKEVLGLARRYRGARRTLRLPEVVALAEPLAASAMESRLRLVLVLGGLPRPAVQYRVPDRRAHVVASVDLAYPEQLIAIEYEGADHFAGHRVVRDVHRYTPAGRPGLAGVPLHRRRRLPAPGPDRRRDHPGAPPPPLTTTVRHRRGPPRLRHLR